MNILGWGFELGNWYSCFYQEKLAGVSSAVAFKKVNVQKNGVEAEFYIKLKKGKFKVNIKEKILKKCTIVREYTLEALEKSYIGDFVVRSVFLAEDIKEINFAKQNFIHYGNNIYYTQNVRTIILKTEFFDIESSVIEVLAPARMELVTYLRDEPPNKWVIHHRLLAKECEEHVLRIYKIVVDEKIFPLLRIRKLRDFLWLLSERKGKKLPFTIQSSGNILLQEHEELKIKTILKLRGAKN